MSLVGTVTVVEWNIGGGGGKLRVFFPLHQNMGT